MGVAPSTMVEMSFFSPAPRRAWAEAKGEFWINLIMNKWSILHYLVYIFEIFITLIFRHLTLETWTNVQVDIWLVIGLYANIDVRKNKRGHESILHFNGCTKIVDVSNLILYCVMSQNGQTYFINLAENAARFWKCAWHFGMLHIRGLKICLLKTIRRQQILHAKSEFTGEEPCLSCV